MAPRSPETPLIFHHTDAGGGFIKKTRSPPAEDMAIARKRQSEMNG